MSGLWLDRIVNVKLINILTDLCRRDVKPHQLVRSVSLLDNAKNQLFKELIQVGNWYSYLGHFPSLVKLDKFVSFSSSAVVNPLTFNPEEEIPQSNINHGITFTAKRIAFFWADYSLVSVEATGETQIDHRLRCDGKFPSVIVLENCQGFFPAMDSRGIGNLYAETIQAHWYDESKSWINDAAMVTRRNDGPVSITLYNFEGKFFDDSDYIVDAVSTLPRNDYVWKRFTDHDLVWERASYIPRTPVEITEFLFLHKPRTDLLGMDFFPNSADQMCFLAEFRGA